MKSLREFQYPSRIIARLSYIRRLVFEQSVKVPARQQRQGKHAQKGRTKINWVRFAKMNNMSGVRAATLRSASPALCAAAGQSVTVPLCRVHHRQLHAARTGV